MSRPRSPIRLARVPWRGASQAAAAEGPPSVADVVRLIYPPEVAAAVLAQLGNDRPLSGLSELRRLMAPFDRQTFPTAVRVNFGGDDVVECEVDGVRLALDTADTSVSRTLIDTLTYEAHVTAVFRRYLRPGMTVVDVGANVGYFSALAAQLVGPEGHVLALEPNSENCRLILLTALANHADNIDVLPLAASDRRGWNYFSAHVGSNGGFIASARGDLLDGRGTVVASFPLDDLVEGPVHFIKLDVEGAEGLVLAGAKRLLERDRPIVVSELSIEMLERVSGTTVKDYVGAFVELGYRCHVLHPESEEVTEVTDVARYLDEWTDIFRLEELLFLPPPGTPNG
ncbi:MAG TPA: FkbM family methyltransferase [Acidimicrobiales bacterium]|jgi:FkbM family methyltransferase